jgi:hypothetical protein
MEDMFKSLIKALNNVPYPRYVVMKKEDAEEVFNKKFKHIPDDTPALFTIYKNNKVTGKIIKID